MKDRSSPFDSVRRNHRIARTCMIAMISAAGGIGSVEVCAQNESAKSFAERSSIVVAGKVVRVNASLEPLQTASPQTVVIAITKMYSGADIAGDQTGHNATVVLSRPSPALKVGAEAVFFGNPAFIGKSLTIADQGELLAGAAMPAAAELESYVQARRDQPVAMRIAAANLVFRGKVESERALAPEADRPETSRGEYSEHDPEWHVASVRVLTPIRNGDQGAVVSVVFPASRDIAWFNSPKLTVGEEAIFITHRPETDNEEFMHAPGVAALLKERPAEVVSEPFDVLPVLDEPRVRALAAKGG
jgi:hypothetical protein